MRMEEALARATTLPLKQRNALMDFIIYDTDCLATDEIARLRPWVDREGGIVVVSPTARGDRIRHYETALRFINKEGDAVEAIVVAGAGSSVVGTAALARTVADAFDIEVAGVVTGYGVSDVFAEALGGWFFFGVLDRWKLGFDQLLAQWTKTMPEASNAADAFTGSYDDVAYTREVETLLNLLTYRPEKLRLLVGHSKGNLVIDFVLEQFVKELHGDDHALFDRLTVVTLGAVIDLPTRFRNTVQIIGELDRLGRINSSPYPARHEVSGAAHHLNRHIGYRLDAAAALQRYVALA